MKFKNVFWGIFFILSAGLIILNQMGMLGGISLFNLVITLLLLPVLLISIRYINFAGILFPLAIIGILFSEPLGIQSLTPWPILGVALFSSIGLSLIFPRHRNYFNMCSKGEMSEIIENISSEDSENGDINIGAKFCASIKYINTEDLKNVYVYSSFSGVKVYFDCAKIQGEQSIVTLNANFSGVELYIPKIWNVINQIDCSMGGIEEKKYSSSNETKDKTLILKGKASFSGVTIIYI